MTAAETDIKTFRGVLSSEAATRALASELAPVLRPGDLVGLSGPVGAGKSALARAMIQAAQAASGETTEDVPSPSYTLVQPYTAGPRRFVHADLYRLGNAEEIVELGLDEALAHAVCLVEWPERLGDWLPPRHLAISLAFEVDEASVRSVQVTAHGDGWRDALRAVKGVLS